MVAGPTSKILNIEVGKSSTVYAFGQVIFVKVQLYLCLDHISVIHTSTLEDVVLKIKK